MLNAARTDVGVKLRLLTFHKPSFRAIAALGLFLTLSFLSERWEGPLIVLGADAGERLLHLNFHTVFGPKPAISVNGLTITLLVRSVSILSITWLVLRIAGGHGVG